MERCKVDSFSVSSPSSMVSKCVKYVLILDHMSQKNRMRTSQNVNWRFRQGSI